MANTPETQAVLKAAQDALAAAKVANPANTADIATKQAAVDAAQAVVNAV